MCLARALLQQRAVGWHRLELVLEGLSQGLTLVVVLERRRQGLWSWRHQVWSGGR